LSHHPKVKSLSLAYAASIGTEKAAKINLLNPADKVNGLKAASIQLSLFNSLLELN
jgi:hypothetical protein